MQSGFTRRLQGLFSSLMFIFLSLLVIAVGEWLPLMPAVQRYQEAHPVISKTLFGVTLAMTSVGTLLLAFTQFLVHVPDPRLDLHTQQIKTKGFQKGKGWIFSGIQMSAGFSDEARMWRLKKAFRNGEWWIQKMESWYIDAQGKAGDHYPADSWKRMSWSNKSYGIALLDGLRKYGR